ncbi:MAG TPA: hypothetical protein VGH28_23850 [Polyangiaceae bacterium]
MSRSFRAAALGAVLVVTRAQAQDLDVRADDVTVDTRMRELELHGHVHADAAPFHLSADALKLKRSSRGIIVEGDGRLTFCPCLGTPIALGFKGATVAPPGDLFLTSPRLEIFHVPVFWLPFFWLRAPDRVGLLPPEISWRGPDGLFLGGGVHLPWKANGKDLVVVDLTGGGYFDGGFAVGASARTADTTTLVRFDRLEQAVRPGAAGDGSGLVVDARGSLSSAAGESLRARAAWDFDLVRGARGAQSITDLDAASRVFDVGQAEASLDGPLVVATGVRLAAFRGGELLSADAAGPYVTVARDGTIGNFGAYDATLDASVLHEIAAGSVVLAHGEAGAMVAARPSIFSLSASLRGAADAAADATESGGAAAALARVELTAPFVRGFETADRADPVRHRIEPVVSVAALAQDADGQLADIAARSFALTAQDSFPTGIAGAASAGLKSALARWARGDGFEVEAHAGGLLDATGASRAAVRWRALAGGRVIGVSAEGAHVFGDGATASGDAVLVRARVGAPWREDRAGPTLAAHLAVRDGVDPIAARLLTDAPLEPASGFFSQSGVTGGLRASVPWTKWLATRGGVDMDLQSLVVTAAYGSIELRDTCGCFRIRVNAAHRLGRDGVDVWTTIDLVPR